jgi:hypothetical protein
MAFITARIVGEPLDAEVDKPYRVDILQSYRPKERLGVERYFCPTCSANMLARIDVSKVKEEEAVRNDEPMDCALGRNRSEESTEENRAVGWEWRVAAGALRVSDAIIEPKYHLNLASTMDGGFADHMKRYGDVDLARYSEGPGSAVLPLPWRSPLLPQQQPEELPAYCHCRSIEFVLSRPGEAAKRPRAPFPDLIYPVDVTLRAKQQNPQDVKWWLSAPHSPGDPTRYLAGYCACDFCRSTSATDIQSWGFIALAHLRELHQKPGEESMELFCEHLRPKGLKQYVSSPGRYREFCGTCGATAFWWHAGRPEVVVGSIGLLDASVDGVRAEHWFLWHRDRVGFVEASPNQTMAKSLQAGMRV